MDRSRTSRRWLALLGAAALIAVTVPVSAQDGSPGASTDPAASTVPAAVVNPYDATGAVPGSGKGKRIGYISADPNATPFVKLVDASILEQAAIAGITLEHCRSVPVCGRFGNRVGGPKKLRVARGVIVTDIYQQESVCSKYKNKPTIAIIGSQPPCEVALMGPNDHEAGRLGGAAMGRYAKDTWDCAITAYVSLEGAAWPGNTDRMGGFRDGFRESCPIDPATEVVIDYAGGTDTATEQFAGLLPTLPGDHIMVVAVADWVALAALGTARTAGRDGDMYFASLGGDETIRKDVACDPHVIASVAYYPERYGRTVIPAMLDIIAGKDVPARLYTVHEVLDATNIRDIYPETPTC